MIEWTIIIICVSIIALGAVVVRNVFRTLNNIQFRLATLVKTVEQYKEYVETLNASEIYYGDPTIEAFVKMSNQLGDVLEEVLDVQRQLTGETDAKKKD